MMISGSAETSNMHTHLVFSGAVWPERSDGMTVMTRTVLDVGCSYHPDPLIRFRSGVLLHNVATGEVRAGVNGHPAIGSRP